ncbi:MAG: GIY-YIG nuclease family protein [Patescibacteria group bacterium]|nr:GIY-YIG nuclease family protein [Patescibacteria group bacterium]MCL5258110.1 GIY-YIG nuclease family protein [Patescibacteria group bacterium]
MKIDLNRIPGKTGVYIFKNKRREPIYIGKAVNLKERIKNHLQSLEPKTKSFLAEAAVLEWLNLKSETEAFLKENELIKKFQPKYNQRQRDDSRFFYLGLTKEKLPKVFVTHQPGQEKNPAEFIGPFVDGQILKTILKIIRTGLPFCACLQPHRKECLNSMIGLCFGWCCQKDEQTRLTKTKIKLYAKNITVLKKILTGRNKLETIKKNLLGQLEQALAKNDLNQGTKLKKEIEAINRLTSYRFFDQTGAADEKTKRIKSLEELRLILKMNKRPYLIEAYDISHFAGSAKVGVMTLWRDGFYNSAGLKKFKIKLIGPADDPRMIYEILKRRLKHSDWEKPDLILVDGGRLQFKKARQALVEQKYDKIKLITLAKPHQEIFYNQNRASIRLESLNLGLKNLILAIDQKTHQEVIAFHRKLRNKID